MKKNIGENPKLISVTLERELISTIGILDESFLIDCLKNKKTSAFVYWQSADKIDFGRFTGKSFEFSFNPYWSLLQDLRVFCKNWELHVWRYNGCYHARMISDKNEILNETVSNCLEQKVKLWGTKAIPSYNGFINFIEDRGMSLHMPVQYQERFNDGINVFLRERRYIKENANGCAGFEDRRFCGIYISDVDNHLKEQEVC